MEQSRLSLLMTLYRKDLIHLQLLLVLWIDELNEVAFEMIVKAIGSRTRDLVEAQTGRRPRVYR